MTTEKMLELFNAKWKLDAKRNQFLLVTADNKVLTVVAAEFVKRCENDGMDWQRYVFEELVKG